MGLFILLLEDNDLLRGAMRKNLVARGHMVFEAATFQQGCELSDHHHFDVALIDWKLDGDKAGTRLIRHLRRGTIPIIVSGFSKDEIRAEWERDNPLLGAVGYVSKPDLWDTNDPDSLVSWLGRVERGLERTPPSGTKRP